MKKVGKKLRIKNLINRINREELIDDIVRYSSDEIDLELALKLAKLGDTKLKIYHRQFMSNLKDFYI